MNTEQISKNIFTYIKINDEKRLIELMRHLFEEEFAQEEKNIENFISGNFSLSKHQIEEILAFTKSIEFKENRAGEKVNNAANKIEDIEHRIERYMTIG